MGSKGFQYSAESEKYRVMSRVREKHRLWFEIRDAASAVLMNESESGRQGHNRRLQNSTESQCLTSAQHRLNPRW